MGSGLGGRWPCRRGSVVPCPRMHTNSQHSWYIAVQVFSIYPQHWPICEWYTSGRMCESRGNCKGWAWRSGRFCGSLKQKIPEGSLQEAAIKFVVVLVAVVAVVVVVVVVPLVVVVMLMVAAPAYWQCSGAAGWSGPWSASLFSNPGPACVRCFCVGGVLVLLCSAVVFLLVLLCEPFLFVIMHHLFSSYRLC